MHHYKFLTAKFERGVYSSVARKHGESPNVRCHGNISKETAMIGEVDGIWYAYYNDKRYGYFTSSAGAQAFLDALQDPEEPK